MHPMTRFDYEGVTYYPIAQGCLMRPDGMIGRCDGKMSTGTMPDRARWYAVSHLAQIANVPVSEIKRRVLDRWRFADLIKPEGWERVVHLRRTGLEVDGTLMPLAEAARVLRANVGTLERRAFNRWDMGNLVAPGANAFARSPAGRPRDRRVATTTLENVVNAPHPRIKGEPAMMGRLFEFEGFVDTFAGHCKANGQHPANVRYRMKQGVPFEKAIRMTRKPRADKGKPNPRRGAWQRVERTDEFPPEGEVRPTAPTLG